MFWICQDGVYHCWVGAPRSYLLCQVGAWACVLALSGWRLLQDHCWVGDAVMRTTATFFVQEVRRRVARVKREPKPSATAKKMREPKPSATKEELLVHQKKNVRAET